MRSIILFLLASTAMAGASKPARFFARRDYPGNGYTIRMADINGDKIPDLIKSSGGVATLLGNGDGTFRAGPSSSTGFAFTYGLAALDLNGDGIIDVVVSGTINRTGPPGGIAVCFGNGDGTFQSATYYQTGSDYYSGDLMIADFNHDGIPDVVTTGESGVWLFIGKGGGVFNPGVLIPIANTALAHLAVADFNGDGAPDVIVTLNNAKGFSVLFGNGNGTFQAPVTYSIPPIAEQTFIAVADLNRDGHPDIVLSTRGNYATANVAAMLNNGKGQFGPPIFAQMYGGASIALGDLNGDGIPDLVNAEGQVSFGQGDGTFTLPVSYAVEYDQGAEEVILADLRRNGLVDIVAGQYEAVSVLLNEGKGAFEDGEWISVAGAGSCAAGADFNGDGKPDLAVPAGPGVVILLGTGLASQPYNTGTTLSVSGPGCPIAADLNGDGIPDLLFSASSLGGVGAYLGKGDGTFNLAGVSASAGGVLAIGDFNHDGKLDFVDSYNQLVLGNGDGTFQPPAVLATGLSPSGGLSWIATGDLNNDGWTDAAAIYGGSIMILLNNQHGGFTQTLLTASYLPSWIVLADFNRDGNLDAAASTDLGTTYIYLGNGTGALTQQPQTVPYGFFAAQPSVGDINGDGIVDLLLPANGTLGVAYGRGDGTFMPTVDWGLNNQPGQILLQNLHQQPLTHPDVVSPDAGGGVTVLINTTK